MTDRVPGAPGRCKAVVTGEELQKLQAGEEFAITLRRDDQPIKEGTPYNKASVLPDELAEQLCPELPDPAPKDALLALQTQKADTGRRATGSDITLLDAVDAPLRGLKIYGRDTPEGTVGENGSVTVKVMGKNIADVRKYAANDKIPTPETPATSTNEFGTTISATTGDRITIKQTSASNTTNTTSFYNGFFTVGFYAPLKVGDTITVSYNYEATTNLLNDLEMLMAIRGQGSIKHYPKNEETGLYCCTFRITSAMLSADNWYYIEIRVGGKSGEFSNFQVEYGSAYTGFEAYKALQTLTVPTPDGLLGGDICDEIDFAKGVLIRRCAEQSETPLPEDLLEAYAKLRSYGPNTRIFNDEGANMEVHYCTPSTAVPTAYGQKAAGKFLRVDQSGSVVPEKIETFVEYAKNADGWKCRIWSDGFVELHRMDADNGGVYPGSCELLYMLPVPVHSNAMVQVTAPGKVFLSDCSLTDRTDLRLCMEAIDGGTEMQLSTVHIYIAGYLAG